MPGTLEGFRLYWSERGDTSPTSATDADANSALVRANDYVQRMYINYFSSGYSAESEGVEEAVYEAALQELTTPRFFSKVIKPNSGKTLTEVSGIKWTPNKAQEIDGRQFPVLSNIDGLLARYLKPRRPVGVVSVGLVDD